MNIIEAEEYARINNEKDLIEKRKIIEKCFPVLESYISNMLKKYYKGGTEVTIKISYYNKDANELYSLLSECDINLLCNFCKDYFSKRGWKFYFYSNYYYEIILKKQRFYKIKRFIFGLFNSPSLMLVE